jgi:hypothetical protein
MAGIVQNAMTQQQPQGQPQPQGKVNPVESIMAAVRQILYNDATHDKIIAMLKQGDPAQAMMQVFTLIMKELATKSKGLRPEMIQAVAPQIMQAIAELAQAAGLPPVPPQALQAAAQQMMPQQPQQAAPQQAAPQGV